MGMRIVIFGAGGAIGKALCEHYAHSDGNRVYAVSRSLHVTDHKNIEHIKIDSYNEESIKSSCASILDNVVPDIIIVANGALHINKKLPEKSLKNISSAYMSSIFDINVITPSLIMKHILPMIPRDHAFKFAALSARLGSISDNSLGGWFSYRSSKAALNMIIKTASIECTRQNPQSVIVGLHPGTVSSELSAPFQKNVAEEKLFPPKQSAQYLAKVINNLSPQDTGNILAWDGQRIEA
jgi:NAD(P)-dependent dehydrogenase (short-subunit alcohol dehydrogenase family)